MTAPNPRPDRLERLRGRLVTESLDALVVTGGANLEWLTGFAGSNGNLVVGPVQARLITDARYAEVAAELCEQSSIGLEIIKTGVDESIASFCEDLGRVGYEEELISAARLSALESQMEPEMVPTRGLVEELRQVKDVSEIGLIRQAARIADSAFARIGALVVAGASERDLAARLDYEMAMAGSHGQSFPTIVASGPNSARPHSVPSSRRLKDGDLVVFDFGASIDGYRSDMTRTLLVGGRTGGWQEEIFDIVLRSQQAGVEAARAGATTGDVDLACRSLIEKAGYGDYFVHGTGHSLGLEIHETPFVSAEGDHKLVEGLVITVEPGIYLPDKGGVRIEDTILVTNGSPTRLTLSSKEIEASGLSATNLD